MKFKSITEHIGNTPLVKLKTNTPATVLAKLEFLNPGGSLKDRSAKYLIEKAEREGVLKPGGVIIDASSGNHGIATAMIGAEKGYKVIITLPEKSSQEKYQALKAYGAEVIRCPVTKQMTDPESYYNQALRLHQNTPGSFMPNQYYNPVNAEAHYYSLGPEIWEQTDGKITHMFAAAGTGGHCTGLARYLKEKNPAIKTIALDSNNSWHATKGKPLPYSVEGMGIDFDSPVLDKSVIDEIFEVSDADALGTLKVLAHKHGILAGPSSGAVAFAGFKYAQELSENDVLVLILGDSGRAYLTKNFY